ncbi:MAG: glycosyltransferase family 4 protein [Magnetococcales bacterium]|nr:glycosyltransferase family 4 protein [Magnetococcales bacterium]
MITVNGKYRAQQLTGVQRYAFEIVKQWQQDNKPFTVLDPTHSWLGRKKPSLWEQFICAKRPQSVLWCPTNTGPLTCSNKVLTLHDGAVLVHPEWFSKKYALWRRQVVPRLLKSSRMVITVSEFSRSVILDNVALPEDRVVAIHNGVNHDVFKQQEVPDALRQRYGIERPYFLIVGSLDPRKNLKKLLSAWQTLSPEFRSNYELLVIGGGGSAFKQQQFVFPEGVRTLGYVPDADLPLLYCDARAFLYPSLFEGFGLTVLEAMACGTPVLTSNRASLPEVAGEAAILVDPDDVEAIADGIRQLGEDDALNRSLIDAGYARAAQFSWQKSAEQTWKTLEAVVE